MKVKYISVIYGFDDIENKINSFIKDKKSYWYQIYG